MGSRTQKFPQPHVRLWFQCISSDEWIYPKFQCKSSGYQARIEVGMADKSFQALHL